MKRAITIILSVILFSFVMFGCNPNYKDIPLQEEIDKLPPGGVIKIPEGLKSRNL